jgi:alpha-N-arabinofuranosidase
VNVIGPIFTEPGGPAWRQTIFHPFKLVAAHAHGTVLQLKVESAKFETKTAGSCNQLAASAIHNTNKRQVVLFVLNRATSEPLDLSIDLRAFPEITGCRGFEIHGANLLATNTASQPDKVKPAEHQEFSSPGDRLMTKLSPLSWNLILLSY